MIRNLGLSLAFVVLAGLVPSTQAQVTTPLRLGPAEYRLNQSYGGFGFEYAQPFANGAAVMDQYGMWHSVPYVASAPPVVVPARPVVSTRTSRTSSRRAVAQPRYQLTTGSLGWTGADGAILYSPVTRDSYGYGYGHGPYGTSAYQNGWKGWVTD